VDHEPVLIATIAVGLTAAFLGGLVARRLRLPEIVGYIVAGVVIGPFTPGIDSDPAVATQLAELGVILLMFGVGIHFSFRDLFAVKGIALPGAACQIAITTFLGTLVGVAFGWGIGGGLVLGLAVSVASTVVLLRSLTDRGELDTLQGRVAIGWLIVQDLFTVFVLVLLPAIAPMMGGHAAAGGDPASSLGPLAELTLAVGKAGLFAALMIVGGARLVPRLLQAVAREGSRELFTLAVLAIALGIAYLSSAVFGVSFALGAFLAGAVVGESDMSHQAAADALPLRDAFAVLFFVSAGMLFDPAYLLAHPLEIALMLVIVLVAQPVAAFVIVTIFGYPLRTALTVAASLGQIGEFSFILGTMGLSLGLLPVAGFQLIVGTALMAIAVNPLLFRTIEPLEARLRGVRSLAAIRARRAGDRTTLPTDVREGLRQHAILAGYGRVGRMIGPALERRGFRYLVITEQRGEVDALRSRGIPALYGDAANPELLHMAEIDHARLMITTTPDPSETRLIVERANALAPHLDVIARTHSDAEAAYLRRVGPRVQVIHGERELAVQMARYALRRFGVSATEAESIAQGLRGRPMPPPTASGGRRPRSGRFGREIRTRLLALSGRGTTSPSIDAEGADPREPDAAPIDTPTTG